MVDSTPRKSCGNCATVRDDGQFCPKCGSHVFHWVEGDSTPPAVEQSPDEVMVEMQLLVNDLKSAVKAIETAAELLGSMVPSHAEAEDNDPVEIG